MNWFSKFLQSGLSSTRTDLPKTFQELAIETRSHDGFLREHAIFELARRANADALAATIGLKERRALSALGFRVRVILVRSLERTISFAREHRR